MYTRGAHDDEVAATLPGDDLVAADTTRTTRAVMIDAPRHAVWSWLAQLGEDRGGFYSYSLLERAVGAHIHNADVVHPEWQNLHVGDTLWLARRWGDGARQVVAAVEPKSYLVLVSPATSIGCSEAKRPRAPGRSTFGGRTDGPGYLSAAAAAPVGHMWFDIPHFVMEQKMMRGIRKRAENLRREETMTFVQRRYGRVRRPRQPMTSDKGGQVI